MLYIYYYTNILYYVIYGEKLTYNFGNALAHYFNNNKHGSRLCLKAMTVVSCYCNLVVVMTLNILCSLFNGIFCCRFGFKIEE